MTVNAVDCTGLSPSQITALANAGVKTVGRYLSHSSWKALNLGEVANLKAAGMQIFSIYESNPTHASYFTAAQGKADALDAIALAKCVGQPANTAIYFTVDYDAQSCDLASILAYFKAVKSNLQGFKLGAYGSFTVLNYLYENNAADYWFQTVAWSHGQHCNFLNIYQFQCDKTLGGVSVDFDNLEQSDIGAWNQPKEATTVNGIGVVFILKNTITRTDAVYTAPVKNDNLAAGGRWVVTDFRSGWYKIGLSEWVYSDERVQFTPYSDTKITR